MYCMCVSIEITYSIPHNEKESNIKNRERKYCLKYVYHTHTMATTSDPYNDVTKLSIQMRLICLSFILNISFAHLLDIYIRGS